MFARDASIGENNFQQDFRIQVGMKSIGEVLGGMALSNLNISSDVTGAKTDNYFEGSIPIELGGPESANKRGSSLGLEELCLQVFYLLRQQCQKTY